MNDGGTDSVAQDHSGLHRTSASKAPDDGVVRASDSINIEKEVYKTVTETQCASDSINIEKKVYKTQTECVDGNWAVAHASYRTNDCAYIFPITPSSPMGEEVDAWAAKHKKNLWGQDLKVIEMQSEGGAGVYLISYIYVALLLLNVKCARLLILGYSSFIHKLERFTELLFRALSPRPIRLRKACCSTFRIFTRFPANSSPRSFTLRQGHWRVRLFPSMETTVTR